MGKFRSQNFETHILRPWHQEIIDKIDNQRMAWWPVILHCFRLDSTFRFIFDKNLDISLYFMKSLKSKRNQSFSYLTILSNKGIRNLLLLHYFVFSNRFYMNAKFFQDMSFSTLYFISKNLVLIWTQLLYSFHFWELWNFDE